MRSNGRAFKVGSKKGGLIQSGADIHPQEAVAEVDNAIGFVRYKLGSEAVKAVAALDGNTGLAQDGHVLGGGVEGLADAFGELGDHELLATGQLAQEIPPGGIADGAENLGERDRGAGNRRAGLGVGHGLILPDRTPMAQE